MALEIDLTGRVAGSRSEPLIISFDCDRVGRARAEALLEIWVDVLRQLDNSLTETAARLMAHAAFGLLNSTPHSVKPGTVKPAEASSRAVLRAMTVAALTSAGRIRG